MRPQSLPSYNVSGFTLIEILVALVIVSIGVLAIGSFGISSMSVGQTSRERLTAVHLAEQIIEAWQSTDALPTLNTDYCQTAVAWTAATSTSTAPCPTTDTVTTSTASCITQSGSKITYSISAKESRVCGAPAAGGVSLAFFGTTSVIPGATIANANPPETKVVTVSWTRRGQTRSVYLTHLSRVE